VDVRFAGVHQSMMVTEVVAIIENKGVVPLRLSDFSCKVRSLDREDAIDETSSKIRKQVKFPHTLREASLVTKDMLHTFVYPGVRTEYSYILAIPPRVSFVRVQADFVYDKEKELSHHAARAFRVPWAGEAP